MRPLAMDYDTSTCSIAGTLAVVGEKWSFLVLREVFSGVRRFADIHEHARVPRQVLTDRLHRLVDAGVLRRVPYREPGQREREEYRLTDKGLELYPLLLALLHWGDRHLDRPDGPPLLVRHEGCGAAVHLEICCADGHRDLSPRAVRGHPGPGARRIAVSAPGT